MDSLLLIDVPFIGIVPFIAGSWRFVSLVSKMDPANLGAPTSYLPHTPYTALNKKRLDRGRRSDRYVRMGSDEKVKVSRAARSFQTAYWADFLIFDRSRRQRARPFLSPLLSIPLLLCPHQVLNTFNFGTWLFLYCDCDCDCDLRLATCDCCDLLATCLDLRHHT